MDALEAKFGVSDARNKLYVMDKIIDDRQLSWVMRYSHLLRNLSTLIVHCRISLFSGASLPVLPPPLKILPLLLSTWSLNFLLLNTREIVFIHTYSSSAARPASLHLPCMSCFMDEQGRVRTYATCTWCLLSGTQEKVEMFSTVVRWIWTDLSGSTPYSGLVTGSGCHLPIGAVSSRLYEVATLLQTWAVRLTPMRRPISFRALHCVPFSHLAFQLAPRSEIASLRNYVSYYRVHERGNQIFGEGSCATAGFSFTYLCTITSTMLKTSSVTCLLALLWIFLLVQCRTYFIPYTRDCFWICCYSLCKEI